MKLATVADGTPDGHLVLVSRDLTRAVPPAGIAATLQAALEKWAQVEAPLRALAAELEAGTAPGIFAFAAGAALAPLPRAWQWLDGSVFQSHGDLMQIVFKMPKIPDDGRPLMYQGMSDRFFNLLT